MMIHLEKGETLFSEKDKVVCETGDYEEQDLVPVGELFNPIYPPDFPIWMCQAIYVKYGVFNNDELNQN